MGIVNIPVYAYIDGSTRGMTNQIIADDNAYHVLYNCWNTLNKPVSSAAIIQRWQDIELTAAEARKTVNDWLNSYLISDKLKFYCANTLPVGSDISYMLHDIAVIGIMPTFWSLSTNIITRIVTLDNVDLIDRETIMSYITYDSLSHNSTCDARNSQYQNDYYSALEASSASSTVSILLNVFPSEIFTGNAVTGGNYSDETDPVFQIKITFTIDDNDKVIDITVRFDGTLIGYRFEDIKNYYTGVNINTPGTIIEDTENPYGYEGTSTTGGGGGKYGDIDGIEPTDVPDLPTVNAASLGLITLYNPTAAQVNNLASYLWSGMFDPDSFKKLFSDPMGCLLGLSIVPAIPGTGGTKNIMFGNVDSGISCSYLSTNYVNVDCGSVSIDEYVGSFLDYEPYCKIQLFLPYCGFVPLSADDVVGGSINVQYNIDVLSGHCVAFVKHSVKGVLYSYSGTCITNIPITSQSFSQALQSYYTALAGVGGAAVGALGSGGGGLASVGSEIAKAAMNTMFDMHPQYQHSGSMGGAAAIMGIQTPFVVIVRPRFSVPNQVQNYIGQTSNISRQLGSLSGFTMVEYIHLQGIPATSEELKEIEALLKEGVML